MRIKCKRRQERGTELLHFYLCNSSEPEVMSYLVSQPQNTNNADLLYSCNCNLYSLHRYLLYIIRSNATISKLVIVCNCNSTSIMSLLVWMSGGDDIDVILNASNLQYLSCCSFHLIHHYLGSRISGLCGRVSWVKQHRNRIL